VLPQGKPHVATKCCWAVSSLSEERGDIMSPYFQNTVQVREHAPTPARKETGGARPGWA
jgi:hypothetical protein